MQALEDIEGLISNKIGEVKALIELTKLEAKLAGLSILPVIINVCMIFSVLVAIWSTTMISLGYLIIWVGGNLVIALSVVMIFNIVFLALLMKFLISNLRKMSFEKTRQYLGTHK
jgi:hypothetical protein